MSRLYELIKKLCPDGVKYKKIFEISTKISSGGTPNTSKPEYYNGDIPWLRTQEVDFGDIFDTDIKITKLGLENSSAKIIPINCVIVAMYGATVGKVGINKIPLTTNQACCNIDVDKQQALYKYVFHFLRSKYTYIKSLGQGSQTNINAQIVKEIQIPLPPLPVQEEIVRILDNFTELTAELIAELTARKKQYEYYKNELFSKAENAQIVTLDMIAENCDSLRKPVTSGIREAGDIPYYGASGIVDYVKDYIFDGDYLLISEDGANLLARSTPIAFSVSGKTWVNNHAHVLKFDEYATRRYVEMYLNSIDLSPYITGAAQPKLNQKNLNNIKIPLPALPEQQRIVDILDRFDTLCNDISSGLPAEIKARQQQYEYYRDKLLTFPKAELEV